MTKSTWMAVGVLGLAGGVAFVRQQQMAAQLRHAQALLRQDNRVLGELRGQNQGWRSQLPPEAERERLRASQATADRLRNEIEVLKMRSEPDVPPVLLKPAERSITNATMPAKSWRNVGRATPVTAVETILWAAAGGDIEPLAGMLRLNAGARAKAEEILTRLPEAVRAQYGTPEHLIALLTAKDVPLGGAGITKFDTYGENVAAVGLHLQTPEGAAKNITVQLYRQDDGWQLDVPAKVMENYSAKLLGEPLPWPEKPWKP